MKKLIIKLPANVDARCKLKVITVQGKVWKWELTKPGGKVYKYNTKARAVRDAQLWHPATPKEK